MEVDYQEYDPFSILGLSSDASMSEIKKQYRRLSKVYHPDKQGGDQNMFMKIAKAYEAYVYSSCHNNLGGKCMYVRRILLGQGVNCCVVIRNYAICLDDLVVVTVTL